MSGNAARIVTLAAALALCSIPALGAEVQIRMVNKSSDGQSMAFEPAAVKVQPGDTIKFIVGDRGHDAAAIKELIPDGAAEFKGGISQEYSVTLDKAGAYVVKCNPHFGMGMVALIVVGEAPANLDAVKAARMPKMARDRLNAEIARLGL